MPKDGRIRHAINDLSGTIPLLLARVSHEFIESLTFDEMRGEDSLARQIATDFRDQDFAIATIERREVLLVLSLVLVVAFLQQSILDFLDYGGTVVFPK